MLSLARSHAKRQLNVRKWSAPLFLYTFDLEMCFAPQRRALFQHLNFQKCSAPCVLHCFVHFDFDMCFGPQRRALFRHVNFQKCSERGVFCTFWPGNVLRATTACNFFDASTSKRVRNHLARWKIKNCMPCGAKHISKSKCSKHHMLEALLGMEMSKKCMPLWREAHVQVRMFKTPHVRTTFGS